MSCNVFCYTCGDCIRCYGDDPCGGREGEVHSYDEADGEDEENDDE